jgi:hypothetical protein
MDLQYTQRAYHDSKYLPLRRICVSVDANAQVKNVLDAFREKLQVSAELELRIYCFNRGIVSLIANPQECCATLPDSTYLYRRFGETIQIALDTWRNKVCLNHFCLVHPFMNLS